MGTTYEGNLTADGLRIALVCGRFNEFIVSQLHKGASDTLLRHGASEEEIDTVWVPGSFEIPVAAKRTASSGRYDAVICLGAVIRGDTPHFDHVAGQAASGIMRAGLDTGVPVTFGVLTTDTVDQAIERAGTKAGNKGEEAALAAVETANVLREMAGAGE